MFLFVSVYALINFNYLCLSNIKNLHYFGSFLVHVYRKNTDIRIPDVPNTNKYTTFVYYANICPQPISFVYDANIRPPYRSYMMRMYVPHIIRILCEYTSPYRSYI